MMIIIGDSLARAFGVAGGAAIVRFRTPVENPREAMILFLLLALGMACGVGAFAIAGLATAFVVLLLHLLGEVRPIPLRNVTLRVTASDSERALSSVNRLLTAKDIPFEPRSISGSGPTELVYRLALSDKTDPGALALEVKNLPDSTVESVTWEPAKEPKKKDKKRGKDKDQNAEEL